MSREKICAFSGHRIDRLTNIKDEVKKRLNIEIDDAIRLGYTTFISGMASGFDTWAAEAVMERKEKGISLVCAVPHDGFCPDEILRKADKVKYISRKYYSEVYSVRNKWMVDNASLVICAYDGGSGGTKQTIDYAKREGIRIINILSPDTMWIE